jgi:hypothetical protein
VENMYSTVEKQQEVGILLFQTYRRQKCRQKNLHIRETKKAECYDGRKQKTPYYVVERR